MQNIAKYVRGRWVYEETTYIRLYSNVSPIIYEKQIYIV